MKGFGENKLSKSTNLNSFNKNNDSYLKKQLDLARHFLISGDLLYSEKIYSQLINEGHKSYDLLFSYALLCRKNSNFILAKKLLFQSISDYPNQVDHYILLAEILRLEKNFFKAEKLLLTASRINPRKSNTLYNLSLLYRDIDAKDKALGNINKAIKLMPENFVYKLLKADLFKDVNNFSDSESILYDLYLNENIQDKKDIMLMLSTVKKLDSKFKEAENILLEIIKNYPKFSQAYLNLSDLYFEQQSSKKAKEIILLGIDINPQIAELYVNLGIICRNLGEINEAKDYLLKALSINKNLFISYLELSNFYDFADDKIELEYLLNISIDGLNSEDISRIYFSRGNIFHTQKLFSKASNNYQLANEFKRRKNPSNIKYYLEKSLRIKKEFYKNKNNFLKKDINSNPELIFIIGMPRSGSTLIENILSLNKEVVDLGEINTLPKIMDNFHTSNDNLNPYEKYINKLNKSYPKAKITTDKNLFNYMYCPVINKYFENSKIILCLRNPLDNILSIFRSNFNKLHFSTSIKDITELYINHYDLMMLYSKIFDKSLLVYNYDDLVINPKVEIKRIIDWLGWEWSEIYLSPHKSKRSVFTASSEQVRNPIHSRSLKAWKNYKDLLKPAYDLIKNHKDLKKFLN